MRYSAVYEFLVFPAFLQAAVDKLISDVAALAAPGSLLHFDFLHLDVLEGRSAAVGYDNTAKASIGSLSCSNHLLKTPAFQHTFWLCPPAD